MKKPELTTKLPLQLLCKKKLENPTDPICRMLNGTELSDFYPNPRKQADQDQMIERS
jgi:hypothetical protein